MTHAIAFDGGGTATRAALYDMRRQLLGEASGKACNPIDCGVNACVATLAALARNLTDAPVAVIAAGISGAGRRAIREAIASKLRRDLETERAIVTGDLRAIAFANCGGCAGVIVIAGTGSSVWAQTDDGRDVAAGGRGVLFGDAGSAYQIAAGALGAAARAIDGVGADTDLVIELPAAAGVSSFDELAAWGAEAAKPQVAALAKTVDALARKGDAVAAECIKLEARRLAALTLAAMISLSLPRKGNIYRGGGVFDHSDMFRDTYDAALARNAPSARPVFPDPRGHRAVLELALAKDPLPEWASVDAVRGSSRTQKLEES